MVVQGSALYGFLFLASVLSPLGDALVKNGENVIEKSRLVRVIDKYQSSWVTDWPCEDDFPAKTCQRIRTGLINIDHVSVPSTELTCAAGWTTVLPTDHGCTATCRPGWYGEDCVFQCRCLNGFSTCNPTDGSCTGCFAGWKGHDCVTRCDIGEYGPNCASSAFMCENSGINHPVNGDCLCPHGHRGNSCQESCDPTQDPTCGFDCELCTSLNAKVCDHILNICLCDPSWTGFYCTEPCKVGSYGLFCEDQCCSGVGHCDVENTRCVCLNGFSGDNCSEICADGYYGRDCKEKCPCPSCDHVTGTCERCPPGYSGQKCTEACQPGRWGYSCNSSCSCPDPASPCDVFTGECFDNGEVVTTATVSRHFENDDVTTMTAFPPKPSDRVTPTSGEDEGVFIVLVAWTAGALFLLIMFVAVCLCYCRHRTAKRRRTCYPELANNVTGSANGKAINNSHVYDLPPEHVYQSLKTISYPRNNLNIEKCVDNSKLNR